MSGMSRDELLDLPATVGPLVAFRALGIGRTKGYELIRTGAFPVRILRIGNSDRVITADLLELLGVTQAVA